MNDIKELARQAAAGDKKAFDSLYEQTKNGVWFTCISLLKNEENAKDIMQETYLTAFEKLPALPNFDNIQGWLNKVAANKCKDHLRSSANGSREESEETIEDIPDNALFPEEYVMDKAKRAIITDIIENKLSEAQSRTIILYYFDELTAAEIAELMGCHEKTVLYRLKTARLKIKEEVLKYENESGDRLHAIVPIPMLTLLLRAAAEDTAVPSLSENASSASENVPANSATIAANTGGKTMLNSLKAKIIAGACAAVVVGGGVTAAVLISNNSNKKPETSITSSPNVSKPSTVSKPQINTSKPETSKPATSTPITSTPVSGDKVVYPKIKGLEPYKFISRIDGVNQPDTVSGNIKEMRCGDRAFILMTNDNEIVMFRADAHEVKVSYGIDPNITTLENTSYDYLNGDGLLAVNGNYIMYKAVGNDGEINLSKQGNPRSFSGNMDFGDRITKVVVGDRYNFYALDAEGLCVKMKHIFWDHSEKPIYNDCVSVIDGDYVYYYADREWGFDVGGVKVKEFAGDYCLTDEGKMFNHDDRKPLDFLSEYTFKDIYYDNYSRNGIISGLTEDGKLVVFDAVNKEVKFSGELPDGELKDIWQNSDRVIVKTDKGVFVSEYKNNAGFRAIEALNGIDEEVVYINGKYVLLGNGFVYTIDELS